MKLYESKKHIGIWGVGREGVATYRFLKSRIDPATQITFLNDTPISETLSEPYLIGDESHEAITKGAFALIIKSPGISLYREEIAKAKESQ